MSGQHDPGYGHDDDSYLDHMSQTEAIGSFSVLCVAAIITAVTIWWDTSRKVIQQNKLNEGKMYAQRILVIPSWAWARMNGQYVLCLLNICVSDIACHAKHFWIFMSISMISLFGVMQLICVKTNATYFRLDSGFRRNPTGMAVFYTSQIAMIALCASFNASVYVEALNSTFAQAVCWNGVLLIHSGCHVYHFVVYYRITGKTVYSDAQLSGSLISFREMYIYRLAGTIDRCVVLLTMVILFVFGNLYYREHAFYHYCYPFFMITLQISNFQSDFRNAPPVSSLMCCTKWYLKKAEEGFEKAIDEMKKRNSDKKAANQEMKAVTKKAGKKTSAESEL